MEVAGWWEGWDGGCLGGEQCVLQMAPKYYKTKDSNMAKLELPVKSWVRGASIQARRVPQMVRLLRARLDVAGRGC